MVSRKLSGLILPEAVVGGVAAAVFEAVVVAVVVVVGSGYFVAVVGLVGFVVVSVVATAEIAHFVEVGKFGTEAGAVELVVVVVVAYILP